jgi:predicted RNA binding protein YcfA (HicA-like mRNA interferase family)
MKKLKDVVRKGVAPKATFGTNPSDPWSAKAGLAEGRTSILSKFILSKGIDPDTLSWESTVAISKTLEFQKWAADRKLRGESVESPTEKKKQAIQSKVAKHKHIGEVGVNRIVREYSDIDEMAGANMDTRAVHQHLKKAGWNLTRSTGSHDVFTHPKSKEHIPVPRHRQLKAPLILSILRTSKVNEDKYQDAHAATQTVGMELESGKSKALRVLKKIREDMHDHEKEDKSVQTYGKKPKFEKTDDKENNGENKPTARAVLSGGKTLTGQDRDVVEIDPSMRNRPGQPDATKKKDDKKDDKSKNKPQEKK